MPTRTGFGPVRARARSPSRRSRRRARAFLEQRLDEIVERRPSIHCLCHSAKFRIGQRSTLPRRAPVPVAARRRASTSKYGAGARRRAALRNSSPSRALIQVGHRRAEALLAARSGPSRGPRRRRPRAARPCRRRRQLVLDRQPVDELDQPGIEERHARLDAVRHREAIDAHEQQLGQPQAELVLLRVEARAGDEVGILSVRSRGRGGCQPPAVACSTARGAHARASMARAARAAGASGSGRPVASPSSSSRICGALRRHEVRAALARRTGAGAGSRCSPAPAARGSACSAGSPRTARRQPSPASTTLTPLLARQPADEVQRQADRVAQRLVLVMDERGQEVQRILLGDARPRGGRCRSARRLGAPRRARRARARREADREGRPARVARSRRSATSVVESRPAAEQDADRDVAHQPVVDRGLEQLADASSAPPRGRLGSPLARLGQVASSGEMSHAVAIAAPRYVPGGELVDPVVERVAARW